MSQKYLQGENNLETSQRSPLQGVPMTKQYDAKKTGGYYAIRNFDLAEAVIGIHP